MTFTAILFDMDGVLVDTEPLHEDAAREVLERHQIPVPDDLFDRFRGRPDRALFADRLRTAGRSDLDVGMLVQEKEAAYAERSDRIRPLPGIVGLLERLRDHRLPLACVTSATRADQQAVFDVCDFDSYFNAVVTADDVTDGKPDPEPFRRGAAGVGADPSNCCVVEDSPHGLRAAQAAGCTTAGLATTFDAAVLEDADPTFVATDVASLRTWLLARIT